MINWKEIETRELDWENFNPIFQKIFTGDKTMSEIQFWGYLHTNGSIQVKRYLSKEDITEARESPFVAEICQPFNSKGYEEAYEHVKDHFKGHPGRK